MRVLVLGASGMIGNAIFRVLSEHANFDVWGSIRQEDFRKYFSISKSNNLITIKDATNYDDLIKVFVRLKPNIIINCIGLTKHHEESADPLLTIPVNALLPHKLADLSRLMSARLIHISTDCVFSGYAGNYTETDFVDATDLYGRSKVLGEVIDSQHVITLRTSTIGHELNSSFGLLEWFLSQKSECIGFDRAFFSGLPSVTFARVIRDYVIPHAQLDGLYHVGSEPISKYQLLQLIAKRYGKSIKIIRDENFVINRSLNSSKFSSIVGYQADAWPELIDEMYLKR